MSIVTPSKTALITGASSGLGTVFNPQLAARDNKFVLTARRKERLQQPGLLLHSRYGIQPWIQPADLSRISEIEKIVSTIKDLNNIDLLISNAGFETVDRFHHVDAEKERAMVNVLLLAPILFCRTEFPGMISRDKSVIINMSSKAGLIPICNVLYQSTNAFLINFPKELNTELQGSLVYIPVLRPGFIFMEFHDTIEYSRFSRWGIVKFLWIRSKLVVSASIKTIQLGYLFCIPGGIHCFTDAFSRNRISAGFNRFTVRLIIQKRRPSSLDKMGACYGKRYLQPIQNHHH